MSLWSDLLTRPFRRPVRDTLPSLPDRRGSERVATSLPVSLAKSAMPPVAAALIDISTTGAAISLHGLEAMVPAPWPARLKHGDQIALIELLDVPLGAWVVSFNEGVLRVRFLLDDKVRAELHDMIVRLAAVRCSLPPPTHRPS